ncbi:MAG TPA: helix-hairpin-helix domain-containing protein [Bacillota bacterium]|nr:helix-hairpin-helix domain-containing protein [Bacillota bacterium]
MSHTPVLPLTDVERNSLRKAKIKIGDIHRLEAEQLAHLLSISLKRARMLKGLADFQRVPSIGCKLAEKLVYQLHIFSLEDIKDKQAACVFDDLEKALGVWTDSCVEDQIRCVIYYANHPGSDRKWHDFTEERKDYRMRTGYPEDRPTVAWYA